MTSTIFILTLTIFIFLVIVIIFLPKILYFTTLVYHFFRPEEKRKKYTKYSLKDMKEIK